MKVFKWNLFFYLEKKIAFFQINVLKKVLLVIFRNWNIFENFSSEGATVVQSAVSETSNPYAICKASMVFVGRAAFAGKLPSCPSPASLCVLQFRPPRNNQSTSVIYTEYTYSFMYFTYI